MASPSSSSTVSQTRSKFTRGEKCIFIHLIVTFCLILFLVVIYFIHLCVVNHSYREVWKISRRKINKDSPETDNYPVGHVYLKDLPRKLLCNTVLLHPQWSVGPAHCVAIRTDPDMADILFSWRIRYADQNGKFVESKIKRTIPHPHFNRDDFRNNIGLFEHEKPIQIKYFEIGSIMSIDDNLLIQNSDDLALFGWAINATLHEGINLPMNKTEQLSPRNIGCQTTKKLALPHKSARPADRYTMEDGFFFIEQHIMFFEESSSVSWRLRFRLEEQRMELVRHDVQHVGTANCVRFMAPILDLRDYEHCVILRQRDGDINLHHGSVFVVGSNIVGFFAWGEKSGRGVPCIILDLQNFKTWLENIIAW